MAVRVKICGIRTLDEALMCASEGADALGFICGIRHLAEDAVSPEKAASIAEHLPPYVTPVLVTHMTDPEEIGKIVEVFPCRVIQLQDDAEPEVVWRLRGRYPGMKIIKAVHVNCGDPLGYALKYDGIVDALLLDTRGEDRIGGTGRTHDWGLSRLIRDSVSCPVILAGGLSPENVQEAVRIVMPYAVDANSRLENGAGFKERNRVREFIRRAKLWTG